MSTTEDEALRVLRFWRDLEIFNIPAAPSAREGGGHTRIATLRRHDSRNPSLPWRSAEFAPQEAFGYVHVVYLGVADMEDLLRLLLGGLFPDRDLSERERQRLSGNGWLAAFVVDEWGRPQPDSYLPASFVQGAAALRETHTLDKLNARLARAKEEFAQRRQRLAEPEGQEGQADGSAAAEGRGPAEAILDWDALDAERRIVQRLLGEAAMEPGLDWRVVVLTRRVRRRYLDEALEKATDFLNSFYLDDLDRLIAQAERKQPFGSALQAYLGPALPAPQRVDLLADPAALAQLLSAKHLPRARWPASAQHPLVLAQQAAVAQVSRALSGAEGLIGINGPPGTGKTTLLCDVVAEIITARAGRIAALERPVALFEDRTSVAGKSFFALKAEVMAGSAIVVSSTNNNAVKNITQELPARKKIAEEFGAIDYFAEVMREVFRAQKVVGEDRQPVETWGAIAAALGNAGNRRSFAQGFFRDDYPPPRQAEGAPAQRDEDVAGAARADEQAEQAEEPSREEAPPPSMKQLLEVAATRYRQYQEEWQQARQAFLALQAQFEHCRQVLERAEQAAGRLDAQRSRLEGIAAAAQALAQDVEARQQALARLREAQADQRAVVAGSEAVLAQLRPGAQPTLWDRLVGLFGRETRRLAAVRQALEAPTRALLEASALLAELAQGVALAESQLTRQRERLHAASSRRATLERELKSLQSALQAAHAQGACHFPDASFWALPAEVRQRASIAVGPQLDELRAKLFLQAVELHRLTVLANAGKFIANLRAVNGMLTGASRDKLSPAHRPLLWDAFFFVVPVVSTTLASFDRLFVGMGQNSLGWLLLDEAGQATPQSAAGAIWRSQRALIVGDPLQIEPVFTVPRSLVEDLRERHAVAPHWSPIDESVQTLADRLTPFGSWVAKAGSSSTADAPERIWTGMPLCTHRRCDEPMFSVANRIAYAGQMVQGRVDADGRPAPREFSCSLGASAWFDVRSTRVAHPVSEDEIACLLDCLAQLQRDRDGKSRIYVISPFRKIAQVCGERLREAGWGRLECGTVHTFQGKEAHIVFLVLGTEPGLVGAGARAWAASKPNLLNVAVTRAQCRLYVIGDLSQWGGLDYFRELREALPARRVEGAGGQNSLKIQLEYQRTSDERKKR